MASAEVQSLLLTLETVEKTIMPPDLISSCSQAFNLITRSPSVDGVC